MRIKRLSVILFLLGLTGILTAQSFVKTSDLFQRNNTDNNMGHLEIRQSLTLDSIISRHILASQNLFKVNNHYGMGGYRIQIYNSNNRNAREESNRVLTTFIGRFPDVVNYLLFAEPGYYRVRVGDFRTKAEAMKVFQRISREFPYAYIVPDIISFPELNVK